MNYDANARRLYFNDGMFWQMGSESLGTEFDAGVLYPTLMQDPNGNQIKITYQCGANAVCPPGTRQLEFADRDDYGCFGSVRGGVCVSVRIYNGRLDSIAHWVLMLLWNFTYVTGTANTPGRRTRIRPIRCRCCGRRLYFQTSGTQTFDYYATGELSQVTLPYGGVCAGPMASGLRRVSGLCAR